MKKINFSLLKNNLGKKLEENKNFVTFGVLIVLMCLGISIIAFTPQISTFFTSMGTLFLEESFLGKLMIATIGVSIVTLLFVLIGKLYSLISDKQNKVSKCLSRRSSLTRKTLLVTTAGLVFAIILGASVSNVTNQSNANEVASNLNSLTHEEVLEEELNKAKDSLAKAEEEDVQQTKKEEVAEEKTVTETIKGNVVNNEEVNNTSSNYSEPSYDSTNNSTSNNDSITAPENGGSDIDHSQADDSLIKDDKEETITPDEDVEITEPEFVPEEQPEQPEDNTNPDESLPNDEVLPDPDQTDFEQPVVALSGEQRVKVGDVFSVTASTSDNIGVTTFNLDSSSIVGLNGNVELQNVSVSGNNGTITLKAVSEGTCKISVAPKVALDQAGNSSAKSNVVNIIIESAEEQPEISPEQPEEQQPEINNPEQPEEQQPEINNPEQPEEQQPEINNPEQPEEQQPEINNPEQPEEQQPEINNPEQPEEQQPEINNPEQPEEQQPEINNPEQPEEQQPEINNPEQPEQQPEQQPEVPDMTPAEPEAGSGNVSGDNVQFE